jgi:hypothetical protein
VSSPLRTQYGHEVSGIVFTICAFILIAPAILFPIASSGREEPDCAGDEAKLENLLTCVRRLIEVASESTPVAKAVRADPLLKNLRRLAETQGYPGAVTDLDILKHHSRDLKRDPLGNRLPITVLDNAIASHVTEHIAPCNSTYRRSS